MGDNKYPATLPEALTLLNRFSSDLKQSGQPNNKDKPGQGRDKKENKAPNPKVKPEEDEDEGEEGLKGGQRVQNRVATTAEGNS